MDALQALNFKGSFKASRDSGWPASLNSEKPSCQQELLANDIPQFRMADKPVPVYAFSQDAWIIANRNLQWCLEHQYPPVVMKPMGPAAKFVFLCIPGPWLFFIFFPWLAQGDVICSDSGGVPTVRYRLAYVFLPLLVSALIAEWHAQRFTLPCQIAVIGQGPALLGKYLPWHAWIALTGILSVVSKLDLLTTALFVTKILGIEECSKETIHLAWRTKMSSSMLPFLGNIRLRVIVIFMWIGMLCDVVIALCHTVPIGRTPDPKGSKGSFCPAHNFDLKTRIPESTNYRALLQPRASHEYAIMELSRAARAATILYMQPLKSSIVNQANIRGSNVLDMLCKAKKDLLMYYALQAAFLLNLQSFALAVNRHVTSDIDHQIVASICCSGLMSFRNVVVESFNFLQIYEDVKVANDRFFLHERQGRWTEEELNEFKPMEQKVLRAAKIEFVMFFSIAFMIVGAMSYAVADAVGAALCSSGYWDLSGCLPL